MLEKGEAKAYEEFVQKKELAAMNGLREKGQQRCWLTNKRWVLILGFLKSTEIGGRERAREWEEELE